ncbi:unnamed protein product, partial [Rotaria magnacalcarata]
EEFYLKPGKGLATTSLSCTNKINRWLYQGIEGTLLNQLIQTPMQLTRLIIQTTKQLSSVSKHISVLSGKDHFEYGPSSQRIRLYSMACRSDLDSSFSIVTGDGYSVGIILKICDKQQYASPLAKCSLFKLYIQLLDNLSSNQIIYAQVISLSSNSLRNQFM